FFCVFFFSSRRRHTRFSRDWSSDVCSSDLQRGALDELGVGPLDAAGGRADVARVAAHAGDQLLEDLGVALGLLAEVLVPALQHGVVGAGGDRPVEVAAAALVGEGGAEEVGDEGHVETGVGQGGGQLVVGHLLGGLDVGHLGGLGGGARRRGGDEDRHR